MSLPIGKDRRGGVHGEPPVPMQPSAIKPVLFVTGHAPPDRIGAFARLHELENVEFALFGGRSKHGADSLAGDLPFPHRYIRQHEPLALAANGHYRAVVCSSGGRVALGATWAGARRAGLPLILWSSLWAHPRSPAHAFSFFALRRLYRTADAVVTYGPHVSAYVSARGARNVHVAPQAVDNGFWSAPDVVAPRWPSPGDAARDGDGGGRSDRPEQATTKFLFVGRPGREKGLRVLTEAWRTTGLRAPPAALVLVGARSNPPWVRAGGAAGDVQDDRDGILRVGAVAPVELRSLYAACDVLVVPSIATATFREPWGLVVNEAMNRGLPVIASDAVGAAAGGLVRHGHNGVVVPAGDSDALAAAMRHLAGDPALRARLGEAGARDVGAYTYDTWAEGFSAALASLGHSQRR
jgi:glycosyltransferase involved in cell wall biosynthesis